MMHSAFLRVILSTVLVGLIVLGTSAASRGQGTVSGGGSGGDLAAVTRFELMIDKIAPERLTIGQSAIATINLRVVVSRPPRDPQQLLTDLLQALQVVVDGDVAQAKFYLNYIADGAADRTIYGGQASAMFALEQAPRSFGWFTPSSVVPLIVTDGMRAASAFQMLTVDRGWPQPLLVMLGSAALVVPALLGLAWWWRKRRAPAKTASIEIDPPLIELSELATTPPPRSAERPAREVPLPKVPDVLLDALAEGRAMLALGAGASAQAGYPRGDALFRALLERVRADLPDALFEMLAEALRDDGAASRLGNFGRLGGFGKTMDVILSSIPRTRVITEIAEQLARVESQPAFHRALAALPWHGLLSLTWDDVADRTIPRPSSGGWRTFTIDEAADLAAAIRSGDPVILRAFGNLDRPLSTALSMEEFRRNLAKAPEFQRALGLLLQTRSFLFIGVGADTLEQFLQAVAPELQVDTSRHFALMPDSRFNDVWATTLSRFGVQILPYDPSDDHRAVGRFVDALQAALRRRPRQPAGNTQARLRRELAAGRITQLKLKNIGLFETLELEFGAQPAIDGAQPPASGVPSTAGGAPWTVIFGGNGCGKSTILKAIGLVLAGNDAKAGEAARRLLKAGAQEGSIELRVGNETLRTQLTRDRREVVLRSFQTTHVQAGQMLVLGFPALRGAPSKNPPGPTSQDPHIPEPADLLPLVNGEVDRRLENFKQWIVNVLAAKDDAVAKAKHRLLDDIIRELVPGRVDALAPIDSSYVIRVETPAGPVPFDDLSQGMASIFNWVGVLVQFLYEIFPDAPKPEHEPAIVLIDEIDAHLHPEWQRQLVELTKKFFPNVQVIASSHSPLLAGALKSEELCVLRRNPDTNQVQPLAGPINTFGQGSDVILTSSIFGLTSDRNPTAERLIDEYFDLFEKAERSDDEARRLKDLELARNKLRYGEPATAQPIEWTAEELEVLGHNFEEVAGAGASRTAVPS